MNRASLPGRDFALFCRQFFTSFHTTGALVPSGAGLARSLSEPIRRLAPPKRILEAGPGTGAVTARILALLEPGDELVLSEINPAFAARLKNRLETDETWSRRAGQVDLRTGNVLELLRRGSFDAVVSGLPLNNFEGGFVDDLLTGFLETLRPGGVHTFFEYCGLRSIRMRMGRPADRNRLRAVDDAVKRNLGEAPCQRKTVYVNLPPAWVYQVWESARARGRGDGGDI